MSCMLVWMASDSALFTVPHGQVYRILNSAREEFCSPSENRQELDNGTRRDQPFVELHLFQSQFNFFVSSIRVSLSLLTVSSSKQIENCGWVETFLDQDKRLLTTRRVQSRSRGTRTVPYAYCGSVCVVVGEHQHRERTLSCVFLDRITQRYSRHGEAEWENEWERVRDKVRGLSNFRRRPKTDQRAQWNCGRETAIHRWKDKLFESLRKGSPLWRISCHLSRKEKFFYSTWPIFKEVVFLCRNTSILNEESTTNRFKMRSTEE